MNLPNKITQGWLDSKGYELGTMYRNHGGYRVVILLKRGRKWASLVEQGPIGGLNKRFKIIMSELDKNFQPLRIVRGKTRRVA